MRIVCHPLWLAGLLLAASCSRKAATISVAPTRVKIYGIERVQRLTGRLVDRKGRALEEGAPSWSSSQPAVVEVDSSGRLTARSQGRAVVKATYQKLETQVPVEVLDIKGLEVLPASARLIGPAGTQFPLRALMKDSTDRPVSLRPAWTSANPNVATVSDEAVVTSVARGTTTVMARLGDLQTASEITVDVRPISKIEIHPATALVRVGDSQLFELVAYGPDGRAIEGASGVFRSSNAAVAVLDASGKASGVSAGIAIIHASLAGVTAEATLIVN